MEFYCLKCEYPLQGLTSCRCPECGRSFDRSNPRTVLTNPGRRRKIHRLVWFISAVTVIALASFGLYTARDHYELRKATERCALCGGTRSSEHIYLGRIPLISRGATIAESSMSRFLEASVADCPHDWRPRGQRRFDWNGVVRWSGSLSVTEVLELHEDGLSEELLTQLLPDVPRLREMIREDILSCEAPIFALYRAAMLSSAPNLESGDPMILLLGDWEWSRRREARSTDVEGATVMDEFTQLSSESLQELYRTDPQEWIGKYAARTTSAPGP